MSDAASTEEGRASLLERKHHVVQGKKPRGGPRRSSVDNIRTDLWEIWWEVID